MARRGVASTIPGSTVFAVMVGVWEPEESRRISNDINKKMIRYTQRGVGVSVGDGVGVGVVVGVGVGVAWRGVGVGVGVTRHGI